jgi:hypothetical protein
VGSTKQVAFGDAANPAITNTTLAVAVDDLIPVPQVSNGP